jgi:hypothetical protein
MPFSANRFCSQCKSAACFAAELRRRCSGYAPAPPRFGIGPSRTRRGVLHLPAFHDMLKSRSPAPKLMASPHVYLRERTLPTEEIIPLVV